MFTSIIDRIKRYYRVVVLPAQLFEDNRSLSKEDKRVFVDYILSKPAAREVLEKYIRWKVGIRTREAMRSDNDKYTFARKERAIELGEITYDMKVIWDEVHRMDEEEFKKKEVKAKKPFKYFGG